MSEFHKQPHEWMPLFWRQLLYVIFVVASVAAPFVVVLTDEVFTQAYVSAVSIVGAFAGVTALAHPNREGRHGA